MKNLIEVMTKKEHRSLEEITERIRKSIRPSKETLRDFRTRALKIARSYDSNAKTYPTKHAKGIKIIINNIPITVCEMQKGKEELISNGVLDAAIQRISNITDIPYEQLELYFKGSGKQYKTFKKRFEDEYNL